MSTEPVGAGHSGASPALRRDRWWLTAVVGLAALSVALLALIVGFVLAEAWSALASVGPGRVLGGAEWRPTTGSYGMLAMIVGSLAAATGAALLALPAGIAGALFVHGFAPPALAQVLRRVLELLAGVPSVVYGLWGLSVIVPLLAAHGPQGTGHSLLVGILVLAFMTLPMVALAAEQALSEVGAEQRAAAAALGCSRWTTLWRVLLPQARGGVATACLLQFTRALGETMVVLMVCGNVAAFPDSLFDPVRTLTANIALEMGYATRAHRSLLFVSGLLLLVVVAALVLLAHRVGRGRRR